MGRVSNNDTDVWTDSDDITMKKWHDFIMWKKTLGPPPKQKQTPKKDSEVLYPYVRRRGLCNREKHKFVCFCSFFIFNHSKFDLYVAQLDYYCAVCFLVSCTETWVSVSEENVREGVVLWFGVSPAPALEVVCEFLLADVGLKRGQFGERFSVASFLTVCFWFMPAGSHLCQLLNYQLLHCCGVFNVPHVTSWLPAIFVFQQRVSETHSKQNEKGKRGWDSWLSGNPGRPPRRACFLLLVACLPVTLIRCLFIRGRLIKSSASIFLLSSETNKVETPDQTLLRPSF